jgi:hypothetical protein
MAVSHKSKVVGDKVTDADDPNGCQHLSYSMSAPVLIDVSICPFLLQCKLYLSACLT